MAEFNCLLDVEIYKAKKNSARVKLTERNSDGKIFHYVQIGKFLPNANGSAFMVSLSDVNELQFVVDNMPELIKEMKHDGIDDFQELVFNHENRKTILELSKFKNVPQVGFKQIIVQDRRKDSSDESSSDDEDGDRKADLELPTKTRQVQFDRSATKKILKALINFNEIINHSKLEDLKKPGVEHVIKTALKIIFNDNEKSDDDEPVSKRSKVSMKEKLIKGIKTTRVQLKKILEILGYEKKIIKKYSIEKTLVELAKDADEQDSILTTEFIDAMKFIIKNI